MCLAVFGILSQCLILLAWNCSCLLSYFISLEGRISLFSSPGLELTVCVVLADLECLSGKDHRHVGIRILGDHVF